MKQRWKNKLRYMWIDKNETKNRMKKEKKNFKVQIMTADFFSNWKTQNAPFLKNINLIMFAESSQRVVLYTYVICFHLLALNPYVSKKVSFIPRNDDNASCIKPERVTNEDSRRVRKKNDSAIGMWYILTNQRLSGENALFSR